MLKTCKSLSLSAAWRDRRPKDMHPKLLAAVRLHLAVLHAAIDEQDLKQAFADRLSPLYDHLAGASPVVQGGVSQPYWGVR
ncbi:hypothetical protein [Spiribacter pallidus]|uniref:hypothetical protein n=1 Tax=Spiribacter pallidus TaxID=1987936 RepID=UPI0034A05CB1